MATTFIPAVNPATAVEPASQSERLAVWLIAFIVWPLAAFAVAGAYYFNRPFWSDEVLSWLIASDASFDHGMGALAGGVDTNAPLLHLLFRAAGNVFGTTPLVYRLTCQLGMSMAFVGLYLTLRRSTRALPATFACLVFASLPMIMAHATEARFYSIEVAALVWTNLWLARRHYRATIQSAIAISVLSIILCGIHYFGVLALGCLVLADAFRDRSVWRVASFKRWMTARIQRSLVSR